MDAIEIGKKLVFFVLLRLCNVTLFTYLLKGNAHHICIKTFELLSDIADDYIRWPSRDSLREVSTGFVFPDTIGLFFKFFLC